MILVNQNNKVEHIAFSGIHAALGTLLSSCGTKLYFKKGLINLIREKVEEKLLRSSFKM